MVPHPSKRIYSRESEFTALVREHQAGVWRYLRFLGCPSSLADDLVQGTFVHVWRKPIEDRGPQAAGAYLRKVAKSRFLMAVRRRKTQPVLAPLDAADAAWTEHARDDDGATYRAALHRCLEPLKQRARRALELFYGEGGSRTSVARELEMTPDGVKTLLRRTRDVLRRCIERRLQA